MANSDDNNKDPINESHEPEAVSEEAASEMDSLTEGLSSNLDEGEMVGQEVAMPPEKIRVPFSFAKQNKVILKLSDDGQYATVKHAPGLTRKALSEIRRLVGRPIKLELVTEEDFTMLLAEHYETDTGETMQMMEELNEEIDLQRVAQDLPSSDDLLEADDDAPIIRLINALLSEAIKEGASDVHIETYEESLVVRFRVDGVLKVVLEPKRLLASLIVSRIKVMANLDIAEKRIPQDGRIGLKVGGRAVDIRVSTMPSSHGERVVLRLLDKGAGRIELERLGMDKKQLEIFDSILHKPHGIILVTGPTGSGKSTTLYAGLTRLNSPVRNVLTVEDPVEYYIDGIGQTQVNTKVDMTFARGLRAILRQDPDVVMIGEIRDLETAAIAVQASITGHLVLSTLHTNTAIGAITRMQDMGIERFLLATTLIGVLAQRLVRRLCDKCKEPYTASDFECEAFGVKGPAPQIYKAVGCDECNQLGYVGRMGIYDLLVIDEELRTMIHKDCSELEMDKYAHQELPTIRQDGWNKVLAGKTTADEVLRVTQED